MSYMLVSFNASFKLFELLWCLEVLTAKAHRVLAKPSWCSLRIILTQRLISSIAIRGVVSLPSTYGPIQGDSVN
jgi:hypothetical protein